MSAGGATHVMISAEAAIQRIHRDLTLGRAVRWALAAAAVATIGLSVVGVDYAGMWGLAIVGGVWVYLSASSAKGTRLAAGSPSLISSGRFDEAEAQLDQALRSFSLFRTPKLLSLHHLATLRHAQRRWQEAAALCRALLGQNLGPLQALGKPARLVLAESLLELGDTRGAAEAVGGLYGQQLSVQQMQTLLSVQLDLQSRLGQWPEMLANVMAKVQLAELMPAKAAARAQALLALAAKKAGRADLAQWLRRRAELLADTQQLATERPILWEVWEVGR